MKELVLSTLISFIIFAATVFIGALCVWRQRQEQTVTAKHRHPDNLRRRRKELVPYRHVDPLELSLNLGE